MGTNAARASQGQAVASGCKTLANRVRLEAYTQTIAPQTTVAGRPVVLHRRKTRSGARDANAGTAHCGSTPLGCPKTMMMIACVAPIANEC